MALSREGLVAKLNATCREGLEEAARLCFSRTHYEVDLEHYLLKLTEMQESGAPRPRRDQRQPARHGLQHRIRDTLRDRG